MLTPRQEQILRKVVDAHLETGQPVGSKTLSADSELVCGPSTIRNELAILEEQGLLAHPHTSKFEEVCKASDSSLAKVSAKAAVASAEKAVKARAEG